MGKRSNKEGYFQKLPSGNYRGQIMDGYRPDGKKNIVSFTARTKGEVQEKIRRYTRRIKKSLIRYRKNCHYRA